MWNVCFESKIRSKISFHRALNEMTNIKANIPPRQHHNILQAQCNYFYLMVRTDKVVITKPRGELSSSPNPAELIWLIKQTDDVEWVRLGLRLNLSVRSIFQTSAGDQCDKGQNTCYYVIRTSVNSKGLYFTSGGEGCVFSLFLGLLDCLKTWLLEVLSNFSPYIISSFTRIIPLFKY